MPVLLVWGMRDPVFQPVFLEQWRELFPNAETVELAGRVSLRRRGRAPTAVTGAIEDFLR